MSDGSGSPTADQIMSIVTKPFSAAQLNAVNKVGSTDEVTLACPSNYNSRSPCFAAVTFTGLPTPENASAPLEYYITGDAGLTFVNAPGHGSDYEKHILPLQWAIDSVRIYVLRTSNLCGSRTLCIRLSSNYKRARPSQHRWNSHSHRRMTPNSPQIRAETF